MTKSLHIGIFNPNTLYRKDGRYTTDGSVIKLYQRWATYFEHVDLCSPVAAGEGSGSITVGSAFRVIALTQWQSGWTLRTLELPVLVRDILRAFAKHHQEWDVVLIPTTNVFGQAVYAVASVFDLPTVVYLRGNLANEILGRNEGVAKVVATLWVQYLDRAVKHIVRGSAVLTAGNELKREYEPLAGSIESIVPSLISREDVVASDARTYPDEDPIRVLYLGRLVEYKRVQDVLAALAKLRSHPRAYEFEIVGDGPYREALEQKADTLGVAEDVIFRGYVSHDGVYEIYDRSDIFVLPSSTEGSPKTVPEALARGCPTVASAVGNIPSLLANDVGVTYEPGDIDALANALDRLGTDKGYWTNLAKRSVNRASQFTIESHLQAIKYVLSETYPELCES